MKALIDYIKNLFKTKPAENIVFPKNSSWMLNEDLTPSTNIEKHPRFAALKTTKHSTRWHKEGSPWDHTLLVAKLMHRIINEEAKHLPKKDKYILMIAALCHDLGKATTTYWDEKEEDWKCKNHGLEGSKITRDLLFDEDIAVREEICWLVRHHMNFHHILQKPSNKQDFEICKLSRGLSTIEKLGYLNMADSLGSFNDEMDIEVIYNRIEKIGSIATNYNCLTTPFKTEKPKDNFRMFVMIGLPGSGKDTYINQMLKDYPCVCRDDLRELAKDGRIEGRKLMLDNEGEKAITQQVNDAIKHFCIHKESFIINQTSLKKKYRDEFTSIAYKYANPEIIYIYVEAPSVETCIERRGGGKWNGIINRMWDGFEFPEKGEYDRLITYRSE